MAASSRSTSSAGGAAGVVRRSRMARASAGTTLRAVPAQTTVGSRVAIPSRGSAGPRSTPSSATRSRARARAALAAPIARACAACAARPRATSSSTTRPFCATAKSSPVGSPKSAPRSVRPEAASSARTSRVPALRVSSPATSARPRAKGSDRPARARKAAVIAATLALASLAPRPWTRSPRGMAAKGSSVQPGAGGTVSRWVSSRTSGPSPAIASSESPIRRQAMPRPARNRVMRSAIPASSPETEGVATSSRCSASSSPSARRLTAPPPPGRRRARRPPACRRLRW